MVIFLFFLSFPLREFQEWLAVLGQLVTLAGRCSNYINAFAFYFLFFSFILFKSIIYNSFETTNCKNVFVYILSFSLKQTSFSGSGLEGMLSLMTFKLGCEYFTLPSIKLMLFCVVYLLCISSLEAVGDYLFLLIFHQCVYFTAETISSVH